MSGRTTNVTVVAAKDLDSLKSQEKKLNDLNDQIQTRSEELERLVKDSMKISGGNEFALSSINFEI